MLQLLLYAMSQIAFLVLHVNSPGQFPPPLSTKKEAEYLALMKNGDNTAREKLIEHNLRLVAHIVKKYYNGNVEQEDLISIGTVGLIKAVSTYNDSKGIRLATYASRCIENEVLMHFRNLKKTAQDVSINDPIDTDKEGNSLTLGDILADDIDIAGDLDLKLRLEKLRRFVKTELDRREQKIICMRYGLLGSSELPQREVAKRLHISRSYVSRIEKKALQKLKAKFDE